MNFLEIKTVAIRDDGCFSTLLWNGRPFAVSVERTFDNGRPILYNGLFTAKRGMHQLSHGAPFETFEILGVTGHTGILFHKGNWETDSEGCVLVGESYAVLSGRTAVADSKGGFSELMELTQGLDEFTVRVSCR